MKKHMLLYIFTALVLGLSILDVITPDVKFSDLENRNLKTKVKFTVQDFFKNSFQMEYEKYINDQFIFRDNWIDLKSRGEYVLGKVENNGIIYGEDDFLFEKFYTYDYERFDNNIKSINILNTKIETPISVMIVPNSYEVYFQYAPLEAPLMPQRDKIDYIYDNLVGTNNISLIDVMSEKKDKYIYYRTDHHWTSYGAYLAYSEFMKSIGENPVNLSSLKENIVEDFYGTYFSKAKPFNVKADIFTYYDIQNIEMNIYGEKYDSLYDYNQLDLRDKYAFYLRGNNALTVIKNKELDNNKKLLVIKDSFANSMVPFLTQNFEEIHIVDLRTFMENPRNYMLENDFDNILILYNFINFTRDANIIKLKY